MKTRYSFFAAIFIGIIGLMIVDAGFNKADSHTNGAATAHTGSPGDGGATCNNCHAGPTPATEAGLITSTIPVSGYTAGQTYTITATVARQDHTKFGFEISPQDLTGNLLGTLILTNTTEMQLIGTGKYITHQSAGVTGVNSRTWTFDWTAPAAGTGDVTFYGAFNITNALNNSSGDTIVLSTLTVNECIPPAQPGAISGNAIVCAGSTQTYSVAPVAGATGYSWTFPFGWVELTPSENSMDVLTGPNGGTILVVAYNDCGVSDTSQLIVSIDPPPQIPMVTISGDTLFSSSANAYQWMLNGSIISGATSQFYIASLSGNYSVLVTGVNGCTSISVDYFFNSFSHQSTKESIILDVSPNPVNAQFLIQSKLLQTTEGRIYIYNLFGEKMQFKIHTLGSGSAIIDVNLLSPAIYLIEITLGEMVSRAKFIKE